MRITKQYTNRESQSLDRYLQEIGKVELLSADMEIDLAKRIKRGGFDSRRALEQLTKANLRFVVSVAKQYQNQGLSLGDLINEGNLGLIKAAKGLMKQEALNLFHMLFGGLDNLFYKHWQNNQELCDYL